MQQVYLVLIALIMLGGCSGSGSSGNGNTDIEDPENPTIPSNEFSISSPITASKPFEVLELDIASSEAITMVVTQSAAPFLLQLDLSGEGEFLSDSTIEVEPLIIDNRFVFSAPMLTLTGSGALSNTFAVRAVRTNDRETSNILFFNQDEINVPAEMRGAPSFVLDLVLKALFTSADPLLVTQANRIKPGALYSSIERLGEDTSLLDQQAEALLGAVFNLSALEPQLTNKSISQVRDGFRRMIGCLGEELTNFPENTPESSDACFNDVVTELRDNVIAGLLDAQENLVSTTQTVVSLLKLKSETLIGTYVERMANSSVASTYASNLAQLTLTTPGFTTPENTADAIAEYLDDNVRRRVYEHIVNTFSDAGKELLNQIGAPESLNNTLELTTEQSIALANIEDSLLSTLVSDKEWFDRFGDNFGGGENNNVSGLIGPALKPFLPVDFEAVQESSENAENLDAETICAENSNILSGISQIGFDCEHFITPFLDETYLESTLIPIINHIASVLPPENRLLACTSQFPLEIECEQIFAELDRRLTPLLDEMTAAINAYNEGSFECSSGYASFQSTNESLITCIHSSLVYTPPSGNCFDGSVSANEKGIDIGGENVCVYFSRAYFDEEGNCPFNYQSVEFLGMQRCRWQGLSGSAVALTINKETGDRTTLIQ